MVGNRSLSAIRRKNIQNKIDMTQWECFWIWQVGNPIAKYDLAMQCFAIKIRDIDSTRLHACTTDANE